MGKKQAMCPKCKNKDTRFEWNCSVGSGEFFRHHCVTCGYIWNEPIKEEE